MQYPNISQFLCMTCLDSALLRPPAGSAAYEAIGHARSHPRPAAYEARGPIGPRPGPGGGHLDIVLL